MNLHNCEIMIKDLADSKRINNQCKNTQTEQQIDSTIVSYLFWPNFKEEKFSVPSEVQE
jgi:anaphase-promoting complex subunit 2